MQTRECLITVKDGLEFKFVYDPETSDPVAKFASNGTYWRNPNSDLWQELLKPGMKVLDLGAHVGMFALVAAAKGCQVVSVEGSPINAQLLRASAEANGFRNLRVLNRVVSDRPGTMPFCAQGPHGHVQTKITNLPTIDVPAVIVDNLVSDLGWDRVDFVKMDIEGSEVAAFRGMRQVLGQEKSPMVIYESNGWALNFYGNLPNRLFRLVHVQGYRNLLIENNTLMDLDPNAFQSETIWDILAVKGEAPSIPGWTMRPQVTQQEVLARVIAETKHHNPAQRRYVIAALESRRGWLRKDPGVIAAIHEARQELGLPAASWKTWVKSRAKAMMGLPMPV